MLAVLVEDDVGLEMQLVPTNDGSDTDPENVPEITNQGETMYNDDQGHDEIFWRHLTSARNHNLFLHFSPDIDMTELQLFQMVFSGISYKEVLLNNIIERIEFIVFI